MQLAGRWRTTLIPVLPPPEIVGLRTDPETAWRHLPEEAAPISSFGALHIQPWQECECTSQTIWILEEAGFGVDADGTLRWDTAVLGTAPAAFRRCGGSFVLINRRLGVGELLVNSRELPPGGAIPLRDEMLLTVGSQTWSVRIA